jgi:oligopeptide/dipeptide ABC transporter ATP-binding protein
MSGSEKDDIVLKVENLQVRFATLEGDVPAVNGVSFRMQRGRTMALVGESGCGKSVTSYAILRLIQRPGRITGGSIRFQPRQGEPVDVTALKEGEDELFGLRGGRIGMVFQEPMTALSPVHSVGEQIAETVRLHTEATPEQARTRAIEMLGRVGIPNPEQRVDQYPFEMSGGMRQRVVIAMALACSPDVLIADEPTTALDVTIQAQIIGLLEELQQELGASTLLITHDLGVVAQLADDVSVMYLGRVIEEADVRTVMKAARHPYTQALLQSLPGLSTEGDRLTSIEGHVPSPMEMPQGCPFHPRCPHAQPGLCDQGEPPAMQAVSDGHRVACARVHEIGGPS